MGFSFAAGLFAVGFCCVAASSALGFSFTVGSSLLHRALAVSLVEFALGLVVCFFRVAFLAAEEGRGAPFVLLRFGSGIGLWNQSFQKLLPGQLWARRSKFPDGLF